MELSQKKKLLTRFLPSIEEIETNDDFLILLELIDTSIKEAITPIWRLVEDSNKYRFNKLIEDVEKVNIIFCSKFERFKKIANDLDEELNYKLPFIFGDKIERKNLVNKELDSDIHFKRIFKSIDFYEIMEYPGNAMLLKKELLKSFKYTTLKEGFLLEGSLLRIYEVIADLVAADYYYILDLFDKQIKNKDSIDYLENTYKELNDIHKEYKSLMHSQDQVYHLSTISVNHLRNYISHKVDHLEFSFINEQESLNFRDVLSNLFTEVRKIEKNSKENYHFDRWSEEMMSSLFVAFKGKKLFGKVSKLAMKKIKDLIADFSEGEEIKFVQVLEQIEEKQIFDYLKKGF